MSGWEGAVRGAGRGRPGGVSRGLQRVRNGRGTSYLPAPAPRRVAAVRYGGNTDGQGRCGQVVPYKPALNVAQLPVNFFAYL